MSADPAGPSSGHPGVPGLLARWSVGTLAVRL
jgi:hypothetical protein